MLRPILAMASERDITRRTIVDPVADHFGLSAAERAHTIPSGARTVGNRSGWAMTFLTKAGLIEKVARGQYRITDDGRRYLVEYPDEIVVKDLRKQPGWKSAWGRDSSDEEGQEDSRILDDDSAIAPNELVEQGAAALRKELSQRLLTEVLNQTPAFFEQLVLDVLLAMGYGGTRENAAAHLGRSGDEGIDGVVNQDALGLDQIMVQAKRYAPDRPVGRQAVQAFIGSLAGQGVTRGVFITTSYFNENAAEFVLRGSNTKVVLVDGQRLIELMMQHHIGVRVKQTIELLELDQNYFDEE